MEDIQILIACSLKCCPNQNVYSCVPKSTSSAIIDPHEWLSCYFEMTKPSFQCASLFLKCYPDSFTCTYFSFEDIWVFIVLRTWLKGASLDQSHIKKEKIKKLMPPPKKNPLPFFLHSMNLLLHSFNGSFIFWTCTMEMNLSWLIQIFHIYLFYQHFNMQNHVQNFVDQLVLNWRTSPKCAASYHRRPQRP